MIYVSYFLLKLRVFLLIKMTITNPETSKQLICAISYLFDLHVLLEGLKENKCETLTHTVWTSSRRKMFENPLYLLHVTLAQYELNNTSLDFELHLRIC